MTNRWRRAARSRNIQCWFFRRLAIRIHPPAPRTQAMKRLHLCRALSAAALLLGAALPSAACAQPGGGDVTAFVDVTVIPMDTERALPGHTVVVRGDRIVAVGPSASVAVPAGARRIDGRGKYLTPGLAEMHGHVPPPNAPAQYTEDVLFLYLANGITTVRGMLGAPGQLELRRRTSRGELWGPTLYLAGPSFNGNSVNSPDDAVRMVREQRAAGWDLLKIHPGLSLEEYDAMARAAAEEGIRFGGHVPEAVGLMHALRMGQETFDHVDGYVEYAGGADGPIDPAKLDSAVRLTREAGAAVVPTMALWEVLYATLPLDELRMYPELRYASAQQVQQWVNAYNQRRGAPQFDMETSRRVIAARQQVLAALHRGGARILMGTDAPQQFSVPGFSLHREFPRMRAAGMTPYDIVATGTRNVGEYFQRQDAFGTVAVGRRADLLLLDADPLADVENLQRIAGVMARGRWMPADEIRTRLEAIAARNPR
jgi:imidazolonepropionase-like amidohydrolase